MKKTLTSFLFVVLSAICLGSPAWGKMTNEELQQKLINQLNISEHDAPVALNQSTSNKANEKPKAESKQTLSEFEKQISSDHHANKNTTNTTGSGMLAALALGDEDSGPDLPSFTNYGKIKADANISVSAWSGMPSYRIPLIHVPGNDGLSLDVTFSYHGMTTGYAEVMGVAQPIVTFSNPYNKTETPFTFVDELGHEHVFYCAHDVYLLTNTFQSRDHWKAKLIIKLNQTGTTTEQKISSFTIWAPNGKVYQLAKGGNGLVYSDRVTKIISKHGKDFITFSPDGRKETLNSSQYTVRFDGGYASNTAQIHQTNGHTITFTSNRIVIGSTSIWNFKPCPI